MCGELVGMGNMGESVFPSSTSSNSRVSMAVVSLFGNRLIGDFEDDAFGLATGEDDGSTSLAFSVPFGDEDPGLA